MGQGRMKKLSLKTAMQICTTAVRVCEQNGWGPICVYVKDPSNNTIASAKMDGMTSVAFPKFAEAKASTAVNLGLSSRGFRDKYSDGSVEKGAQMMNMVAIMDGGMATFPGGVLIKCKESKSVLGSVGVSGATGDQDEFLALNAAKESIQKAELDGVDFDPPSSVLDDIEEKDLKKYIL